MDNNDERWQMVVETFQELLSDIVYKTWFKNLTLSKIENNVVYLQVNNNIVRNLLNSKHKNFILETIRAIYGEEYSYEIILSEGIKEIQPIEKIDRTEKLKISREQTSLNPNFLFDNFVVGDSNRLAHSAAMNVSNNPGFSFNPLFIYGGSGLGKTHLMHAIGNYIYDNNPTKKILYVTSEKFLSDFMQAVRYDGDINSFKSKYRNVDVLLIDDIQFFKGKKETIEEFFHTFNELYDNNKQIILTADKAPQDLEDIPDRLKTRFKQGIQTDIQSPNLETRMGIVNEKAKQYIEKNDPNLIFPDDVIEFIAESFKSNIRDIEGSVKKVILYSKLKNENISVTLAKEALKDLINSKPSTITISYIQDVVSTYYGFTPDDLKAKKRTKELALARQVAIFLSRELTDESTIKIGDEFGGRDHSTILHAIDKIEEDCQTSTEFREQVEILKSKIISL